MKLASKVSSKYQVVIPSLVRKKLNIEPEMEIIWIEVRPGSFIVTAHNPTDGPEWIDQMCGAIKDSDIRGRKLVDEFLTEKKEALMREQPKK